EAPREREFRGGIDRRDSVTCRQADELVSLVREKRVGVDENPTGPLAAGRCKCGFDLIGCSGTQQVELDAERAGSRSQCRCVGFAVDVVRIEVAAILRAGTSSCSSSSRLRGSSPAIAVTPVMFLPGLLMLSTKPTAMGSSPV